MSTEFAAIERATQIVQVTDGVATTTSMRVANGTDNEHASVLRLIRDNLADFEEFGRVGFAGGVRMSGKVIRNRYSEKADKKRYFRRVEVHEAPRFRGSEVMHTLKITPAGAEAIARLIAREVAA